jgi:hypothetical protein
MRVATPRKQLAGRLTRAALYALGATSVSLGAACSSSASPVPVYGCPGGCEVADAGPDVAKADAHHEADAAKGDVDNGDAPSGPDGVVAAYGAPPIDAATD